MNTKKFHCPYCGAEMTKLEEGKRGFDGELAWFVSVRYICPACSAMGPVIDSESVDMRQYPGHEYDNSVLRKLANEECDKLMDLVENGMTGKENNEKGKEEG